MDVDIWINLKKKIFKQKIKILHVLKYKIDKKKYENVCVYF